MFDDAKQTTAAGYTLKRIYRLEQQQYVKSNRTTNQQRHQNMTLRM